MNRLQQGSWKEEKKKELNKVSLATFFKCPEVSFQLRKVAEVNSTKKKKKKESKKVEKN